MTVGYSVVIFIVLFALAWGLNRWADHNADRAYRDEEDRYRDDPDPW